MRRALCKQLPALTKFYNGAIHPLNVDEFTTREISEYIVRMDEYQKAEEEAVRRGG